MSCQILTYPCLQFYGLPFYSPISFLSVTHTHFLDTTEWSNYALFTLWKQWNTAVPLNGSSKEPYTSATSLLLYFKKHWSVFPAPAAIQVLSSSCNSLSSDVCREYGGILLVLYFWVHPKPLHPELLGRLVASGKVGKWKYFVLTAPFCNTTVPHR